MLSENLASIEFKYVFWHEIWPILVHLSIVNYPQFVKPNSNGIFHYIAMLLHFKISPSFDIGLYIFSFLFWYFDFSNRGQSNVLTSLSFDDIRCCLSKTKQETNKHALSCIIQHYEFTSNQSIFWRHITFHFTLISGREDIKGIHSYQWLWLHLLYRRIWMDSSSRKMRFSSSLSW